MGKVGGFIGVFTFAPLMHWGGLPAAETAAAIDSLLGAAATILLLPETKGRTLEELNDEAAPAPSMVGQAAAGN